MFDSDNTQAWSIAGLALVWPVMIVAALLIGENKDGAKVAMAITGMVSAALNMVFPAIVLWRRSHDLEAPTGPMLMIGYLLWTFFAMSSAIAYVF